MNLKTYIEEETESNKLSEQLVSELRKISNDIEFIAGVLLDVENDEDKITLLEYIENDEAVDFEQVVLNSLWLSQQREKKPL